MSRIKFLKYFDSITKFDETMSFKFSKCDKTNHTIYNGKTRRCKNEYCRVPDDSKADFFLPMSIPEKILSDKEKKIKDDKMRYRMLYEREKYMKCMKNAHKGYNICIAENCIYED